MPTAIIDVATGYVVEKGAVPDGATYAKVTCATNPDPRREKWNGSAFVSKTQSEINTYDAAQLSAVRDKDLALRALKALATAVHKRFKAQVPTDPTTAAQWKAAIDAEWDAL